MVTAQQNKFDALSQFEETREDVILASSGVGNANKEKPSVQEAPRPQSKKSFANFK
jgi:hypothetical protein